MALPDQCRAALCTGESGVGDRCKSIVVTVLGDCVQFANVRCPRCHATEYTFCSSLDVEAHRKCEVEHQHRGGQTRRPRATIGESLIAATPWGHHVNVRTGRL